MIQKHIPFLFIIWVSLSFSQVKGGDNPSVIDASAMIEMESTNKGVLLPRLTTVERTNITSPANGLMVYDKDTDSFWIFKGSAWSELMLNRDADTEKIGMIVAFACPVIPEGWAELDGTNSLLTTNYPSLAAIYPSWVSGASIYLPDYRGYFLRGTGNNSDGVSGEGTPGTKQTNSTATPTIPFAFSSSDDGAHTHSQTNVSSYNPRHTHSVTYPWSGHTNYNGNTGGSEPWIVSYNGMVANNTITLTRTGDHTHTVTNPPGNSTTAAHSHTLIFGDDETRPQNVSVKWAVRIK